MGETPELLGCPFCGGPARKQKNGVTRMYFEVVCDECDFCGPAHDLEAEAIAAWNRRTPPNPEPEDMK